MALIRVYQQIENDVWLVRFVNDPDKLSEDDKRRMRKYGEPEIDLGGVFMEDTPNEFTLPSKKAKIRSDFPYTQEFDSLTAPFDENTQTKVEAFRDEILSRIEDALDDLRSQTDTFSGELTYNF